VDGPQASAPLFLIVLKKHREWWRQQATFYSKRKNSLLAERV
jgi:hypothetical protein